jgi:hypothetical protein
MYEANSCCELWCRIPPNTVLQRTVKSVTPFACAKAAPLSLAAELERWAAGGALQWLEK